MIGRAAELWRRRYWSADPAALAAYETLRPIKVVTGGSEGIGLAIAAAFVKHGDEVLLIARGAEALDRAARELDAAGRVHVLSLDVTVRNAADQIDATLADIGGYCDVLVNAAGIGIAGSFADSDADKLDTLVSLNVAALARLTRHVLPGMIGRGRGGIINVASLGGYVPGPYQAAYYASKAFVISLTEAIAYETSGFGVRVSVVVPGPVRTRFHTRMGSETSLYRLALPAARARSVGRLAVFGFRLGVRVVPSGPISLAAMIAVRLLPHRLSMPIVAFLLKPRPYLARSRS